MKTSIFYLVVLSLLSLAVVFGQNTTGTVSPGSTPPCGTSYCGNARCEPWFGESCDNCAYDCGLCPSCDNICGNLRCEAGETACNCPKDCGVCCVDGWCNLGWENPTNCPSDCVGSLNGWVVDTNNTAIAGATVACQSTWTAKGSLTLANVTSAANGRFSVPNTPVGNYTCYAYAAGYWPSSDSVDFRAGSTNQSLKIVLAPLIGSISGELRDLRTGGYLRVVNVSCVTPFTATEITDSTIHKFSSNTYFFDDLKAATYQCTASKKGWESATQTVTVTPANNTVANFYLRQLPKFATGYVLENRYLQTLSPASIYCRSNPGNETLSFSVNANGFYNVSVTDGVTYICEASSPGYLNNTFTLDCPYFKNVTLTPLSCIISVTTVDTFTGERLPAVDLDFHSTNITNGVSDGNGFFQVTTASWSYSYVTGSKSGYIPDSEVIYCNKNGTASITLYLTPIPNCINVLVLSDRTGRPIPNARVNLNGASNNITTLKNTNATGFVSYCPIGSGTYTADASAAGYYPNSTVPVGTLTFNQTVTVVITLKEVPCTVIITVYDTSSNTTLEGATLFILPEGTQFVTGPSGVYQQDHMADRVTGYNASKTGYTSETGSFTCGRNRTVSINVYLSPLPNTITVEVRDADTNQPLPAWTNLVGGSFQNVVNVGDDGRNTWSPVPAGTYTAFASLENYVDNNTLVGTVERNDTLFAVIYLRARPCVLNVLVIDNSTGAPLDAALVAINANPVESQTTTGTGSVSFTLAHDTPANLVGASKDGYTDDDESFTCARGRETNITLYLAPLPNNIFVQVRDVDTNELITTASVTASWNGKSDTRSVNGSAIAAFTNAEAGTYTGMAAAPGYSSNTSDIGTVMRNNTIFTIIYLKAIGCTLIVNVVDTVSGEPVEGATLTFNAANPPTSTTPSNGQLTFAIGPQETVSQVTATKTGYTTDDENFNCGRNVTQVVTLRITPLLNTINVIVRDIRTNDLINTASITLTGLATPETKGPGATATWTGVKAGTYSASASAPGYGTNSTSVGTLTFNQTVTVTIYLGELTCVVTVNVIDIRTGALIPNPNIQLNNPSYTSTTNPANFTIRSDEANSATASASGYRGNDTAPFTCTPGGTQNVTLRLAPIIRVFVSAVDTFTPGRPRITDAEIFAGGVLLTEEDPDVPGRWILEIQSVPYQVTLNASALGFQPSPSTLRTFNTFSQELNISLAPLQFTLFFTPYQSFSDGTKELVPPNGFISNNILQFPDVIPNPNEVYYPPAPKALGGSARRTTGDSYPYVTNSYSSQGPLQNQESFNDYLDDFLNGAVNLTSSTNLVDAQLFAAVFPSMVPSSQSPFFLTISNITGLDTNFPAGTGSSLEINIPEFSATRVRNLILPLPHRLNFGFLNIRASAFESNGNTPKTFAVTEYVTAQVTSTAGSNFKNLESNGPLAGKRAGLFEFPITFSDFVQRIVISFQGEFYSVERSGWVLPDGSLNNAEVIPDVTSFSFPPQDIYSALFEPRDGQLLRRRNAKIFVLRDYKLIAVNKRRTTKL